MFSVSSLLCLFSHLVLQSTWAPLSTEANHLKSQHIHYLKQSPVVLVTSDLLGNKEIIALKYYLNENIFVSIFENKAVFPFLHCYIRQLNLCWYTLPVRSVPPYRLIRVKHTGANPLF